MIIRNKDDVIIEKPFRDLEDVRINWDIMVSRRFICDLETRFGCGWRNNRTFRIRITLISRNMVVEGINDFWADGSKVEKCYLLY